MYTRNCPKCGKELIYSSYHSHYNSKVNNRPCRSCSASEINNRPEIHKLRTKQFREYAKNNPNGFEGKHHTEETKAVLRARDYAYLKSPERIKLLTKLAQGKNNPMYGKTVYQQWVKKYGKEEADRKMDAYRKKQSINNSGEKNSMFGKCSPHGAGNGWSGWYNKWYFRSILELSYMINIIEKENKKWISAERKDLTIEYVNWDGTRRTYRADFFVEDKYLIECKPKKLFNTPSNKLKREAAEKFCNKKGLIYQMVDIPKLSTGDLTKLYEEDKITFTEFYDKKFREKFYKEIA